MASQEARWVAFLACGIVGTLCTVVDAVFELGVVGVLLRIVYVLGCIVVGARQNGVGAGRTWGMVAVVVLSPVVWLGFYVLAMAPWIFALLAANRGDHERLLELDPTSMMVRLIGIGVVVPMLMAFTAIAVLSRRAQLGVGLFVTWCGAVAIAAFSGYLQYSQLRDAGPETTKAATEGGSAWVWPAILVAAGWVSGALWFVFTPPRGDGAARSAG